LDDWTGSRACTRSVTVSRFDGQVAVVTGAASGMGRATATAFAAAGASVVVADISTSGLAGVAAEIEAAGGTAVAVTTDVCSEGDVAAMVATALERFGRLDAAVNAAGIAPETGPLVESDVETFDRVIAVNLRSMYLCLKHEIGAMLPTGGAIVNIASTSAFRPQHQQAAYAASKHGVLGLTRSAAIDYATAGVRVNAICPGAIDTPMLRTTMERRGGDPAAVVRRLSPLGRFGTPDEIAAAALWLCSAEAAFVVGDALAVDGGYLAR